MTWHSLSIEETLEKTGSKPEGLDDATVQKKIAEHGKNELVAKKKIQPGHYFLPAVS